MKALICVILSFLFFFTATAQTHVLQAGRQYLLVNQDGSVRLDNQASTQLYLGSEGQIYTKDHNLYFATDYDRGRLIHFTPADAKADKLIFETNPSGSGRFITKRFYEGTLYLVVSGAQLKWRKNRSEGIPVLLNSYRQVESRQRTTNDTGSNSGTGLGRTSTSRESSREDIAAAKKRQQEADAAAATEKKRQEEAPAAPAAPKKTLPVLQAQAQMPVGRIEVVLSGAEGKCTDFYAELWSTTDPDFKGMQQKFKSNCQAYFSGLKDGTYKVALYMTYVNEDGTIDSGSAEYERQKLDGKDEVTIFKGNQKIVKFESK